jgi:hypothetical protein
MVKRAYCKTIFELSYRLQDKMILSDLLFLKKKRDTHEEDLWRVLGSNIKNRIWNVIEFRDDSFSEGYFK